MISKTTSSIILASLSALSNSVNYGQNTDYSEHELYAIELAFNAPESLKITSDEYVSLAYDIQNTETDPMDLDLKFLGISQLLSDEQVDLDSDFIDALDSLFYNNTNTPSKKRF